MPIFDGIFGLFARASLMLGWELRSADTPHLDLAHSLAQVRQEHIGDGPVDQCSRFRVICEGRPRPLNPAVREEAYRIAREALVNAFRHARSQNVEVKLEYGWNALRIFVRDDGRGIDRGLLTAGRNGHFGLLRMRDWADRIGSQLRVRSAAAAGTEVELTIPSRVAFKDHRSSAVFIEHLQEKMSTPAQHPDYEV